MFRLNVGVIQGVKGTSAHWQMTCCGVALTENVEAGGFDCPRCHTRYSFAQIHDFAALVKAELAGLEGLLIDLAAEHEAGLQEG